MEITDVLMASSMTKVAREMKEIFPSNRLVRLHGNVYSLDLTKDENDEWNLAIAEIKESKSVLPEQQDINFILNCFFENWKFLTEKDNVKLFNGNDIRRLEWYVETSLPVEEVLNKIRPFAEDVEFFVFWDTECPETEKDFLVKSTKNLPELVKNEPEIKIRPHQ